MSYPDLIFTADAQLGNIIGEIVDLIVANTAYVEADPEIIALRECAVEVVATTNSFMDLDSYPPGEPNTRAMKERIVAALSGSRITNGSETVIP